MHKIDISRKRLIDLMSALYSREINEVGNDGYLVSHSRFNSMRRQIDVFEKYIDYIKPNSKILDWGCRHAPDSCLIREVLGKSIKLHGCDFANPGTFKHFHEFSQIEYLKLTNPVILPYEDQFFDAVVASGVIEHTAMEHLSLAELHRVIKENGYLIITFLPNRNSYTEFIGRLTRRRFGGHLRLYSLKETNATLRKHGFIPIYSNYHQFLPAQRMQGIFKHLWPINKVLEKTWPTKPFCSSIMFVAKRCPTN